MIEVHHLNNSRSQRILWLLEELELEYSLVSYQRDAQTNLAPDSLKAIHPLGKSPVVRDGALQLYESGAIVEYILDRYGQGRLAPPRSSPDYLRYLQLLHFAEGSAMTPVLLKLYLTRLAQAAEPLLPRVHSEIENNFGFLNAELGQADYFLGSELTAADVMLSFPVQAIRMLYTLDSFPKLAAWRERVTARPAYARAIERGGPYLY